MFYKQICDIDDITKPGCVIVSFGVSNDNSFEKYFAEDRGCTTHSFDPTPGVVESMKDKFSESNYNFINLFFNLFLLFFFYFYFNIIFIFLFFLIVMILLFFIFIFFLFIIFFFTSYLF